MESQNELTPELTLSSQGCTLPDDVAPGIAGRPTIHPESRPGLSARPSRELQAAKIESAARFLDTSVAETLAEF